MVPRESRQPLKPAEFLGMSGSPDSPEQRRALDQLFSVTYEELRRLASASPLTGRCKARILSASIRNFPSGVGVSSPSASNGMSPLSCSRPFTFNFPCAIVIVTSFNGDFGLAKNVGIKSVRERRGVHGDFSVGDSQIKRILVVEHRHVFPTNRFKLTRQCANVRRNLVAEVIHHVMHFRVNHLRRRGITLCRFILRRGSRDGRTVAPNS